MRIAGNVLALAVFALANPGQTPSPPGEKPHPAPPAWRMPLASLKPEATVAVSGKRTIVVTDDAVWIASREGGSLARVDPKTNAIVKTIAVGKDPCGLLSAAGGIWTPLCGQSAIARVDPKKDEVAATMPSSVVADVTALASGVGSVWVITDAKGTLVRIDPATNTPVAEIYLAPGSCAMAFGQDALWIVSGSRDVLTRLNPYTNLVVETIKVGKGPRAVAIGDGAIWTLNQDAGSVSRVDPKTNKVAETIEIGTPGAAGQIVAAAGSVWVSRVSAPLTRIDTRTNHVVQQFTGESGGTIAFGQQALWIAATPSTIWRLDPKLIEATRPR